LTHPPVTCLIGGMKCATKSCNEETAIRVFWPGQTSDMCPACALRARNVASAMGFALTVAVIGPPPIAGTGTKDDPFRIDID